MMSWQIGLDACSLPRAQMLVRAFYGFLLYLAAQALPDYAGLTRARELQELWPIAWLEWLPPGQGAGAIVLAFLLVSLVAAAAPGWPGAVAVPQPLTVSASVPVAMAHLASPIGLPPLWRTSAPA